jgi:Sec-independent protein translocase protein TatA
MSWIGDHAIKLEEWAKALFDLGDEKAHAIGRDIAKTVAELKGDVPALEAEVKADAAHVVKTAETQGVKPAIVEAEGDAVALATEAAHDVEAAVTAPVESAHSTARTAAVIAGEAAVASTEHHA